MKTTLDIPEETLASLMKLTKAGTKRDAILEAIESYIRRRRTDDLVKLAGTFKDIMCQDDLTKMREGRAK